jgi:hypothetical protein
MEIRKYTDIVGAVVTEDIVEGRMVLLAENTPGGYDFGSRLDLPGLKLPADETEANRAKFCVTWQVSNATAHGPIKLFIPQPSFDWALRQGGWDQSQNVPFSADVHLTYPGNRDSVTIPSGYQALAFDRGVFRVPSGQFVYSSDIELPGAQLSVANTADDGANSGMLQVQTGSETVVAVTEHFDSDDASLTFRTL